MSDPRTLQQAVAAGKQILSKLSASDRVQLRLPMTGESTKQWLEPDEAARRLDALEPDPVEASSLALPPLWPEVSKVFVITAGAEEVETGPRRSVVRIAYRVPPVRIATFSGRVENDRVQLLLRLVNDAPQVRDVRVVVEAFEGDSIRRVAEEVFQVPPRSSRSKVVSAVPAEAYAARIAAEPADRPGLWAGLARRPRREVKIAILGQAPESLHLLVGSNEELRLVEEAAQADLVLAYRTSLPEGKAGVQFAPEDAPEGFLLGPVLENVVLAEASLAVGDPLLDSLDLSLLAVRRLPTFEPTGLSEASVLGALDGGAFLIKRNPSGGPRRLIVSFDPDPGNTNFSMLPSFVVLLGNVLDWIVGPVGAAVLESRTTRQAVLSESWTKVDGPEKAAPGLYRTAERSFAAVSWPRLSYRQGPADWTGQVEQLVLPDPQEQSFYRPFRPWLLVGALGCWATGWALGRRLRRI